MKKKILIVDDESLLTSLLKSRLGCNGFEVETAGDGQEGLDIATRWHPDLILLDILMPVMDGFEACKRLKAHNETRDIPIVIITAADHRRSPRRQCLEEGAVDMITKPFEAADLLDSIHEIFNGNRHNT
jgi:two-component system, cell cycle response regulator